MTVTVNLQRLYRMLQSATFIREFLLFGNFHKSLFPNLVFAFLKFM